MNAVEFLSRVAVTGRIVGLGLGSSTGQIRDVLGDKCVADRRKQSLRLDYGLLEFSLTDGVCEGIAIQVHRLVIGVESVVPDVLRLPLSGLSRTVSFADVRAEIERDQTSYLEEPRFQSGYRSYKVSSSSATIFVVDGVSGQDVLPAPGDLWAIMISG